jgi:hypothetical protein
LGAAGNIVVVGWEKTMAKASCYSCVYAFWDKGKWLWGLGLGMPGRPVCANHPDTPGLMREIPPGEVCRNYRAKPKDPDLADGTVKRIPLAGGLYVYVDAADFESLNKYTWRVHGGYAVRTENKKRIYMHREIMQPPKSMVVDHMDGNRLNDCRINLRICTPTENGRNKAKYAYAGSTSRFKGVGHEKDGDRWYSKFCFNGKSLWLGFFDEEIEAARAYDYRAVECGGLYAWVNLPEEWPPQRRRKVHAKWLRQMRRQNGKKVKTNGKGAKARTKAPARKARKHVARDSRRSKKPSPSKARHGVRRPSKPDRNSARRKARR